MIMPTHVRVALSSLRSTPVRTGLTTLGIIVGVTAITLVLALGEGVKQTISRQVDGLDAGLIIVKPGGSDQREALSRYSPFAVSATSTLTERDASSIAELKQTTAVAPLMFVGGSIKYADKQVPSTPIVATTSDFLPLMKLGLSSGQFVNPELNRDTVVLGHNAALSILGTDQSRGQEIIIKGRPHTVIGVLRETRAAVNIIGVDLDRSAYVSLEDGKSFNQGIAQIQQLILRSNDPTTTAQFAAVIDSKLLSNHQGERDFSVIEGKDAATSVNSFYNIVVWITALVASIALVVGGIGIMNIMLVGVTERTREIGIRKALGATNRQIMLQFLVESLTMSLVGGVIGLAIGYLAAFFISTIFTFQLAYSWLIVLTALGLALVVGVVFGTYPALKASRKDPIEALRQYE